jgi:cation transport protein ChaC
MEHPVAYFAYGSLVNRHTRSSTAEAIPVRIAGWVRQWRHCVATSRGKACALTAERQPGADIEGVLILDSMENMTKVDEREIGYKREEVRLEQAGNAAPLAGIETYIYVSAGPHTQWGSSEYPIWRSYLDCVLAGYIDVWGRDGAARFIASTSGWQAPILDDRHAPKYPRAVVLPKPVRNMIEEILEQTGVIPATY